MNGVKYLEKIVQNLFNVFNPNTKLFIICKILIFQSIFNGLHILPLKLARSLLRKCFSSIEKTVTSYHPCHHPLPLLCYKSTSRDKILTLAAFSDRRNTCIKENSNIFVLSA